MIGSLFFVRCTVFILRQVDLCFSVIGVFRSPDSIVMKFLGKEFLFLMLHVKVVTFLKLVLNYGENGGSYRNDLYFSIINGSNYFS